MSEPTAETYSPGCHWSQADPMAEIAHGYARVSGLELAYGAVFLQLVDGEVFLVNASDEYGQVSVPWAVVVEAARTLGA